MAQQIAARPTTWIFLPTGKYCCIHQKYWLKLIGLEPTPKTLPTIPQTYLAATFEKKVINALQLITEETFRIPFPISPQQIVLSKNGIM